MDRYDIRVESLLATLPLFSELGKQEITRISMGTQLLRVARDTTVFHRGDRCTGFYVVVHGQVKLGFTSTSGNEKVVKIITRGGTFGEAVMFMDRPHIVYAQALCDCLLLHVAKATVFAEISQDPLFARKMLAGISLRLHSLVDDVEAYSLHSGMQRVIGYLLRYETGPADAEGRIEVRLPANKGIIASRLNLTPETFSRILHDLARSNLISINGKTVHILDEEKLRCFEA
jgi:CRP/FNR family transcriptional regulator, dissimilatory nitrate respiration regulator